MLSALKRNLRFSALHNALPHYPARPVSSVLALCAVRLFHRTSITGTMTTGSVPASVAAHNNASSTTASTAATATPAATTTTATPLSRLIPLLHTYSLAGFIVPSADAHQSEYVAECDMRRAYISGFDGSAGTALVLSPSVSETSKLWTDGRYFLQASQQLSSDWQLMRQRQPGVPELEEYIGQHLPDNCSVGVDPTTVSINGYKALTEQCKPKNIQIVTHITNLIDEVWGSAHRPHIPNNPIIVHGEPWAGQSVASKVAAVRSELTKNKCHALVVSTLDEIAWLLNVRGSDVEFNPVFFAYVVVSVDDVVLFVEPSKVSEEVRGHFGELVTYQPYSSFFSYITQLKPKLSASHRLWLDPLKANQAILAAVSDTSVVWLSDSPVGLMKSVKNDVEVAGVREAHKRDAAAMCEFLCWLEAEVAKPGVSLDEVSIGDKLAEFRGKQKWFMGLSFNTIAGSGGNGAIIHYHPMKATAAPVNTQQLLLLDSGAQYRDGTTDITRTMHLGTPTAFQRLAYTRVLQGHIALARAVFPTGTVGPSLDILARQPLWRDGLDYGHGTGHGVGAFLNVHEGPIGISASMRSPTLMTSPLQVGNVVTNEPGYYHGVDDPLVDGSQHAAFGIRIENVMIVREAHTRFATSQGGSRKWLCFDTVSLTPISRKLMDVQLLSEEEVEWLDEFHAQCWTEVGPRLEGAAKEWLRRETLPIKGQS